MTYAEILKCDAKVIKEIYERCVVMLADMTDYAKCRREFLPNMTKEQAAFNLYRLCRGLFFYGIESTRRDAVLGIKLDFDSLEELDLKLAMRGY